MLSFLCKSFILFFSFVFFTIVFLIPQNVHALNLSRVSDIMTRLRTDTPADHTIQFTAVSGVGFPNTGDTITISFGDAISSMNSVSYEDIQFLTGDPGQELSRAVYSERGVAVWGVAVNSVQKTITFTFPSSNGTPITTNQRVIIRIGTNASGTKQLINGSTPGSHTITLQVGNRDSRTIAIALLQNDAVGAGGPAAEQTQAQAGAIVPPASTPTASPTPTPISTPTETPQSEPTVSSSTPTPTSAPVPSETVAPTPISTPTETPQSEPTVSSSTPTPTPEPIEISASTPTQSTAPTTPTPIVVSLGVPANIKVEAGKVTSASVINTDTRGQTTGFFAEAEEHTVTEDGNISIEPIPLTQASNLDSEIRIPSGKDVPDKVFYKINISTKVEKPIRITIKYNPDLLAGIDPSSLKINHWDPVQNKWIPIEETILDAEQNTLSAYVIPQTIYAALATVTSREDIRKRGQLILKSSIKFIPRNSGVTQTDLELVQKTGTEPIRFVNYDFYTSGAREMNLCIKEKLFLRPIASVILEFMNKQQKLFYNKPFKCFSGFITSPIDEGTYPLKLKVIYKDDYSEIISPNLVVTTPFQALVRPIMRWIIEDIESSPIAMAGVYGSAAFMLLGIWFAIDRRLRKIRMISPLSALKK